MLCYLDGWKLLYDYTKRSSMAQNKLFFPWILMGGDKSINTCNEKNMEHESELQA